MTTTIQKKPRPDYPAWFNQAIVAEDLEDLAEGMLESLIDAVREATPTIALARTFLQHHSERLSSSIKGMDHEYEHVHDATGLGAIYDMLEALHKFSDPDSTTTIQELQQRLSDPYQGR